MKKKEADKLDIVDDLIAACEQGCKKKETARKAVRAICREFGGGIIYISKRQEGFYSSIILTLFEEITDNQIALAMLERVMTLLGSVQIYIPLERTAFKNEIAIEVFEAYDGTVATLHKLKKELQCSFNHLYRLYHIGKKLTHEKEAQKCSLKTVI